MIMDSNIFKISLATMVNGRSIFTLHFNKSFNYSQGASDTEIPIIVGGI